MHKKLPLSSLFFITLLENLLNGKMLNALTCRLLADDVAMLSKLPEKVFIITYFYVLLL